MSTDVGHLFIWVSLAFLMAKKLYNMLTKMVYWLGGIWVWYTCIEVLRWLHQVDFMHVFSEGEKKSKHIPYLRMYRPHIFLPKIQEEKWGAVYIRNNLTHHVKKMIFIIHNFYSWNNIPRKFIFPIIYVRKLGCGLYMRKYGISRLLRHVLYRRNEDGQRCRKHILELRSHFND
jgi:hypothetical protein